MPASARRTRVGLACSRCRARKVKCVRGDQTSPAPCERCNQRGFKCKYVGVGEELQPADPGLRTEETSTSSTTSSVEAEEFLEEFNNYVQCFLGLVFPTQPQPYPLFPSPYLPSGEEEEWFPRDDSLVYGSSPRGDVTHNQVSTGYPNFRDPDREFTMSACRSSTYADGFYASRASNCDSMGQCVSSSVAYL
ncbi:hypothetical protein B0H16DRAFT_1701294 [Mycena metata]|uniref:Zn(2)-C6 fungal-type domain-containing protein n=1 Tax=Mycena metata TaxID=1033252 RepID=A0AAD7MGQ7_9AGAR|nr:hypothetical protein B0H16DRAFT_1701294 [Mycena metata]